MRSNIALCALLLMIAASAPLCSQAQQVPAAPRPEVKVGDQWTIEERDPYSNTVRRTYEEVVDGVAPDKLSISYDGKAGGVATRDLTLLENYRFSYDNGYQLLKFPMDIGGKWNFKTKWANKETGSSGTAEFSVEVLEKEKITVPAGTFDALRLRAKGYMYAGGTWVVTITYWYSPEVKRIVKQEWRDTKRDLDYSRQLIAYKAGS